MAKVLLFGGSFDPIHFGHLIIGRYAAETLGISRVILLPGARPPHKRRRRLAPARDRLAMCRLAIAGDPQFAVDEWELQQRGPSYTLRTVQHFRDRLPADTEVCWLVGMDSLVELGTWFHAAELVECCTLVTAARPGYERPNLSGLRKVLTSAQVTKLKRHIVESPRIDISATDVRARVLAGLSIRYLVPEAVRRYIAAQGLYRRHSVW